MSRSAAASEDPLRLFFADFIASAESTLERLETAHRTLSASPQDEDAVYVLVRGFHALKGNSSFFEGAAITPIARAAEEAMERVHESGTGCTVEQLDLLARVIGRLRGLISESAGSGEPVLMGVAEERLALALDAVVPFNTESRYFFWGQDVTEEIKVLAELADRQVIDLERHRTALRAVRRLSRVTREADVHDVARSIEAIDACLGSIVAVAGDDEVPAEETAFDSTVVRAALRALSPMLQRESRGR